MNKKIISAGNEPGWENIPDPFQEVNVRIAQALGYVVEAQDGIIKCWSMSGAERNEQNWIALPDFVSDEETNAEMLDENGYQFFVVEEDQGLWVCAFHGDDHMGVTPKHISEALALADALYLALKHKSVMT